MSRYGFTCCSCGSSMLKPTESPPPSLHPRFAASITPGPPPVTTHQPASPKRRPAARASSYSLLPSLTLADPNSATAGRSICATFSKPARNSSAIFATDASIGDVPWSRIFLSSVTQLQAMLCLVRRVHAEQQHRCGAEVERVRREREPAPATEPQPTRGAPHGAAVEDPERNQVEQVQEEAGVGERREEIGRVAAVVGERETHRRGRAAEDRPGDRDAHRLPRMPPRVLHVRPEERHEDGQLRVQPLALRLDEVAHLVQEDQQDEAGRELPAEEERIGGERNEDARELDEDERTLPEQDPYRDDRPDDAFEALLPVRAARLDRLVVALPVLVAHEPLPIHSSPPSYTSFFQSGTRPFSSSIASLHAASASWRCGAESLIMIEVSPIPTRPTRWWIATPESS